MSVEESLDSFFFVNRAFFDDLEQSVQQSPYDKGPVGSMPDSAYCECNEDIGIVPSFRATASSQWDVDVVSEPMCQGNVPSVPEVCDTDGEVGIVEILFEIVAQCGCCAYGHERIAGEVCIELDGIENGCHQE